MSDNLETSDPEAEIKHLPGYARDIGKAFAGVIELLERGKEDLVADQDFDRAAALRDLERRLKKYRDKFINEWPKSRIKDT